MNTKAKSVEVELIREIICNFSDKEYFEIYSCAISKLDTYLSSQDNNCKVVINFSALFRIVCA